MNPRDDFQDSVRRFARAVTDDAAPDPQFRPSAWQSLADLGALAVTVPGSGGTPGDMCRCLLELGGVGFVGPLVESLMAAALPLGELTDAVANGSALATVTWSELVPWGGLADVFVLIDESERARRAEFEPDQEVATLAGDPWARGRLVAGSDLGSGAVAIALGELAVASYVVGAATRAVEISADYGQARRQFGRPIATQQAVSHPLAASFARLSGLADLLCDPGVELASLADREWAARSARLRLIAVEAATTASYAALQTHGGMGFVRGTLVAHLVLRIRQVALSGVPQRVSEERASPAERQEPM